METPINSSPFFGALLSVVFDEVLLIEMSNLQIVDASASVLKRLGCDVQALRQCRLESLLGGSANPLREFVARYQEQLSFVAQETKASQAHFDDYVVSVIRDGESRYILLVRNDSASREHVMAALGESESRFQALVNNTPGLVFEFRIDTEQGLVFDYLSEGCKVLLGVEAETLKQQPRIFLNMILPEDIDALQESISQSATEQRMFNWEGRFWIQDWQDIKWVNIRALPRRLANGQIQWNGMMTNITQTHKEKMELQESRRQLAELSVHSEQVIEQERMRIAREIHDDLGGNLTAIKIALSSLSKKVMAEQPSMQGKLEYVQSLVNDTFETAHRISKDLRPNILDLGIVAALEWQSAEFEKQIGTPCHFYSQLDSITLSIEAATVLFRICQEAMSNIAKHAQANAVWVTLKREADMLVFSVQDDGVGLQAQDKLKPNSFGLRGMRERVMGVHGEIYIENAPERGVCITVTLPMGEAKQINAI